jgi:hypothetical protein
MTAQEDWDRVIHEAAKLYGQTPEEYMHRTALDVGRGVLINHAQRRGTDAPCWVCYPYYRCPACESGDPENCKRIVYERERRAAEIASHAGETRLA